MSQPGGSAITVLHVDDSSTAEANRSALERADERFVIEPADSVETALAVLENEAIDCVLSEYDLNDADAFELLEGVREVQPALPFVLCTGEGSEAIASEAIAAGVTDYVRKPVSGTALANRIEDALSRESADPRVQRTRAYFSTILDHACDYVLVADAEGRVKYVSPAIENVLGYAPREVIGTDGFEYVHPDDEDAVRDALESLLDGSNEDDPVEYRARHADGSWRWHEARGRNCLEDPVVEGIILNCRDVTDRVEYRHRLETVIDNLPGYVYRHRNEPGWPLEFVKGSAEEITGYTAAELENDVELAEKVVHPEDREFVREATEEGLEADGSYDLTYRFLTADGETRWIWERGSEVEDPITGETVLDGFVTDITEQKEQEQTLKRQNRRLEEFASVVSHDLRNPLNVATGRLELARQECESDHLEDVVRAHERMNTLIEDLLELAREKDGVSTMDSIDLPSFVHRCWGHVETDDASLDIEVDRTVCANGSRLRQLFENLFRNAVEHGGEDVTVVVGPLEDGFYVADTGPGIPSENHQDVFEVGYSSTPQGTGFGLGIVRQVADAHGWEIELTGTDGARFEFTGVGFDEDRE